MKLLITGIPGMGKTTIGDFLRDTYQFKHINFEDGVSLKTFGSDPTTYVKDQCSGEKVVISWGFVPADDQINAVRFIESRGFKLIWFDGNRDAAFREYIKAGRPKDLFDLQLTRINESNVIRRIEPKIINTFDEIGNFKGKDLIVKEIGIS